MHARPALVRASCCHMGSQGGGKRVAPHSQAEQSDRSFNCWGAVQQLQTNFRTRPEARLQAPPSNTVPCCHAAGMLLLLALGSTDAPHTQQDEKREDTVLSVGAFCTSATATTSRLRGAPRRQMCYKFSSGACVQCVVRLPQPQLMCRPLAIKGQHTLPFATCSSLPNTQPLRPVTAYPTHNREKRGACAFMAEQGDV